MLRLGSLLNIKKSCYTEIMIILSRMPKKRKAVPLCAVCLDIN